MTTPAKDYGAEVAFVSFSKNYWDDLWQSRHQIMSLLAREHKVLFVSPPFSVRDAGRHVVKGHLPPSGVVHREGKLYTLVFPKWLFFNHRFPRVDRTMSELRNSYVRLVLRKLNFRDIVLFIWHPHYHDLIGRFGERLSCYYVDEEFSSYYEMSDCDRAATQSQEDSLLRRVDLVLANGKALLELKNSYGNAINVPMGVDFGMFAKASLPTTPVPGDLDAIQPPRIGYVGNVNDKVDFRLLDRLAQRRPDWSFVLIGPVNVSGFLEDFRRLTACQNVFVLGLKPRESLPYYLKGLDVGLVCYKPDAWATLGYPLKLHEYLAGGKPVVSTDVVSIREFSPVVRLARTDEEWLSLIQEALLDQSPEAKQIRISVARQNTWDHRVQCIEQAIAGVINARTGGGKWAQRVPRS